MSERLRIPEPFACVVLSPAAGNHAGLAVGAARAGGVGVLDLQSCGLEHRDRIAANLEELLQGAPADRPVGLRLHPRQLEWAEPLLDRLDQRPHVMILHGDTPLRLAGAGATVRQRCCTGLWVEVDEPSGVVGVAAPETGVDAVIAVGHECGGAVGEMSSFLLAQRLLAADCVPVLVRGVPGVNAAAACRAVGARGVVVDDQALLLAESPLPLAWQRYLEKVSGQDVQVLGARTGAPCSVLVHPAFPGVRRLQKIARDLEMGPEAGPGPWLEAVAGLVGWGDPAEKVWPLGQTAALAASTRDRYRSVGRLVGAMLAGTARQVDLARTLQPLAPESPLAMGHGTRYPIVQGPMTRVSDRPEFALEVSRAGALPMVALALAKPEAAREVLEGTARLLGDRPWGVGILGFVPREVREAQIREVLRVRPRFALIAGGRPDQAAALEKEGLATYLHVPVPSLLQTFLDQGARRFVFEGRECGGHVGPLSSFILWEQAVDTLLARLPEGEEASVLFAGGIHDARSAAMVSALASPLAERGLRVGVLMGTAYLFTREAVTSGALHQGFQDAAVECRETVTLESAVGHANRCADTPFAKRFYAEKARLLREGRPAEEVREELDDLILGRLRLASKAKKRGADGGLVDVDETEQQAEGMFMMGEVAALRTSVTTCEDLHREVSEGAARAMVQPEEPAPPRPEPGPCDVAIVGLALHVPGATGVEDFWRNLLTRRCAIREVPADRWDWRLYYDENKQARDRSYSRWGGWVDDLVFDPLRYGIPPNRWNSINSSQILGLELARRALEDAGFGQEGFDRKRTSAILASGDVGMLGGALLARSMLPLVVPDVSAETLDRLPEWTEDSFPGVLASLCSGRLANRLDFGGSNFIVDAACASSLTAVDMGCHELASGRADTVLVGAVDIGQTPFDYIGFSKVQALSPSGRVLPFDRRADGIVLSEGAAFAVLKRLADAERDGDRIYAVIRAVGTSSDGRSMGLTAPHSEGQLRSLERAWKASGLDPATLELYEAHATGTALGDRTELETVGGLLERYGAPAGQCALGSVKSLVGHTKRAAGLVSLAKAALALHHRVLPPHLGAEEPLGGLRSPESPLYLLDQPRPWFEAESHPRRAAVSAFGFGGTNAHVVLEEHRPAGLQAPGGEAWPAELVLLGETPGRDLAEEARELREALRGRDVRLRDVAYTMALRAQGPPPAGRAAAVVAGSAEGLEASLDGLLAHLDQGAPLPPNVTVQDRLGARAGRTAFLFPGQGSQYPNPALEATLYFPEIRRSLEQADRLLAPHFGGPLTRLAWPPAPLGPEGEEAQRQRLRDTWLAQPLLGALALGFHDLMLRLGFRPDCTAGHSYGEFSALRAGGVLSQEDLLVLSEARGRAMRGEGAGDRGAMAAVSAPRARVEETLKGLPGVVVANHNAPGQTVISGEGPAVKEAVDALRESGLRVVTLPVSGGFHSPAMASAQEPLVRTMRSLALRPPALPVYSNLTGQPYPPDVAAILEQMQAHLLGSVEFVEQIRRMAADGVRTFVEMGPGAVLTGLVGEILPGPETLAVALDVRGAGLKGFLAALGRLRCAGVPWSPVALFEGRDVRALDLRHLPAVPGVPTTSWIVNPNYMRPASDPRPRVGREGLLMAEEQAAGPDVEAVAAAPAASPAPPNGTRPAPPAVPAAAAPPPALPPAPERAPAPALPSGQAHGSLAPLAPAPAGAPLLTDARVLAAYEAYQETMRQFLRTQERVMAEFLQSLGSGPGAPPAAWAPPPPAWAAPEPAPAPPTMATAPPAALPSGPNPAATPPADSPAPSPAPGPAPRAAALDREGLERELVRIVQGRTGYPPDMLGVNLDLEAHLGIDSIKRVEIVEELLELAPPARREDLRGSVDDLIRIRTLAGLAEAVWNLLTEHGPEPPSPGGGQPEPQAPAAPPESGPARPCARYLMAGEARPLEGRVGLPEGLVLVTEDRLGVAAALLPLLEEHGVEAALVGPADVQARVAGHSHLGGVVHLAALADRDLPDTLEDWHQEARLQVKSLYEILRRCGRERLETALLLTASRLGGHLGREGRCGPGLPLAGGPLGFARTMGTEWPGARAVHVDFDGGATPEAMARHLLAEMEGSDAEVGYPEGIRTVFEAVPAPLAETGAPALEPSPDWVVLATGGARGITAELALALSRPGMRLVLAGRTPLEEEPGETRGLDTPEALRSFLVERARRQPKGNSFGPREPGQAGRGTRAGAPTPAAIEQQVEEILRRRAVAGNLERFRQAGCQVEYHSLDVADGPALAALLEDVYRRHGRLDAVLHGAGVIQDKLLEDKTPESWDLVFHTKVDGLFHLWRHLRPDSLKLLVLFSSVAGRFGNRGQGDYAAANEVLNRMAWRMRERFPGARVLSVNWGPWANAGMAGEALQQAFRRRGIEPIGRPEGIAFLEREIRLGARTDVEVVAGRGDWNLLLRTAAGGPGARSPAHLEK